MVRTLINQLSTWGISLEVALGIVTGVSVGFAAWTTLHSLRMLNKCIDLLNISNKVHLLHNIEQKGQKIVECYEKLINEKLIVFFAQAKEHLTNAAQRKAQNLKGLSDDKLSSAIAVLDKGLETLKKAPRLFDKVSSARAVLVKGLETLQKGQYLSKADNAKIEALDLPRLDAEFDEWEAQFKGAAKDMEIALKEIMQELPEVKGTPIAAPAKSGTLLTDLTEGAALLFGFNRATTQHPMTDKTAKVRPRMH